MPESFSDSTLLEVLLMIQGYRMRTSDQWQIMRQHAYISYCLSTPEEKRITIWEMMPLLGDPTVDEIEKMKKEESTETQRLYEEGQRIGLDWIKDYQQKGMLN